MILPERLIAALKRKDLSQSELARRVGISTSMVNKLVRGVSRDSAHIYAFARALDTTPEYLSGDIEEPELGHLSDKHLPFNALEPERDPDLVELAQFNIAYGLGASYIHDTPTTPTMRAFSRNWIRQFTPSPFEALYWASGIGPSMSPAILDSDNLLIDTAQRSPRMWDQFWAIEMHGLGMVKSLRPGREGSMRIVSINQDFPEEVAYDDEMTVIGRVVAIARKV